MMAEGNGIRLGREGYPLGTPNQKIAHTQNTLFGITAFLWERYKARRREDERNLDFSGGGKISVRIEDVINSPKVQEQVAVCRELQRMAF